MKSRLDLRRIVVAVLAGVLIGGGLMAVTPAGAEVAQAAATNWKKIWKNNLQPLADKRYYTKKKSDKKYATKSDLGNYWTKAESDAKYQPKGNYALNGSSYTKAESDARYAPYPVVTRGVWGVSSDSSNEPGFTEIVYPQLAGPPTTHYIPAGALPPGGCSGTAAAPNADPGHLCIFEVNRNNVTLPIITPPDFSGTSPNATAFGATLWVRATGAATNPFANGTYAVRPSAAGFGVSSRGLSEDAGPVAPNRANVP